MPRKELKTCPNCHKTLPIRTDCRFCSKACSNSYRARSQKASSSIVVAGDFHFPFQDEKAVDLFLKFLVREQPGTLVINGDLLDCWEVSGFAKNPARKIGFKDELEIGAEFLKQLRATIPESRIVYVEGNHEFRLQKYVIAQAPALHQLLHLPQLLELDSLRIEYVPCKTDQFSDTYIQLQDVLIGHFAMARMHSGYTAKNLLDRYGMSLIQAHVHSTGLCVKNLGDREITGIEGGCLCSLNPGYCKQTKWRHAWTVIHRMGDKSNFELVQLTDYSYSYGGKIFH